MARVPVKVAEKVPEFIDTAVKVGKMVVGALGITGATTVALKTTKAGGTKKGGGGKGTDDSSGDEGNLSDTDAFTEIRKKSTDVRKSESNTQYVRVGNTKYWLSRDKAGHAGSHCKVYEEKGNNLHLRGSVPQTIFKGSCSKGNVNRILKDGVSLEDFDIMSSKHESRGGMQISLSDLHRIK